MTGSDPAIPNPTEHNRRSESVKSIVDELLPVLTLTAPRSATDHPNGKCEGRQPNPSATGPSANAGKYSSPTTSRVVATMSQMNVSEWIRNVPAVTTPGFCAASVAATAMIGRHRPTTVAIARAVLYQTGVEGLNGNDDHGERHDDVDATTRVRYRLRQRIVPVEQQLRADPRR